MKVKTDVKAGGGLLGGIDIVAVLVVDVSLFGGSCGCKKSSCGK